MSETVKTWFEVETRYGWKWGTHATLPKARDLAAKYDSDSPENAPFKIIRVTETREEAT